MPEVIKPVKSIVLPLGKISYTASHDWLRMSVKLKDTSSVSATISWGRAKTKAATTSESAETIKAILEKWSIILKKNDGSPLEQMIELQKSAYAVLK